MTKLYLTNYARKKLRYYVELCEDEISGFGKLDVKIIDGDRYLVMTDLVIFKQVCTAAHSTIDDEALGKFLYEQTKAGEDLSKWKIWWHSHAKMDAFFSSIDTATIEKSTEFPYLVSLVSNHEGDIVARLDLFDPVRHTEDLSVEILPEEDNELKDLCEKEIQEKVTLRPYHQRSIEEPQRIPHHQFIQGSKKWRKLKASKRALTSGDPGYDFDTAEWDTDLGAFVNYQTSTSKDNKTFITQQSIKSK